MRSFSPSAAAFEGFRIVRAHPLAILAWAAVSLVMQLALAGILMTLIGPTLMGLPQQAGATMPPMEALRAMGAFSRALLVVFPVMMLLGAIVTNAVFRPVLRPEDKGLLYLRIGGDELRLFLLQLAWLGGGLLAEIVLIILVAVVAVSVGLAAGAGGHGANVNAQAGGLGLAIVIGGAALICLGIWIAVRFSLAAPMTFAEKRVRVFGSWRVTEGRFWPLFGCYLLALIFAILIAILGWIVAALVGVVISGGAAAPPATASPAHSLAALASTFTAAGLVRVLITTLFNTIGNVIVLGAVAAAYRALTEKVEAGGIWD